jgi:hypothetical protein
LLHTLAAARRLAMVDGETRAWLLVASASQPSASASCKTPARARTARDWPRHSARRPCAWPIAPSPPMATPRVIAAHSREHDVDSVELQREPWDKGYCHSSFHCLPSAAAATRL